VAQGIDRRQYKRVEGVVYFAVDRVVTTYETLNNQHSNHQYKRLDVLLSSLSSYIEYKNPKDVDIYRQIVNVMHEITHEKQNDKSMSKMPGYYYRQPAIVSGNSFEFSTHENFSLGEQIALHLSFPIYPFSSIILITEVTKISVHSGIYGDKRVVLRYLNINPEDCDEVVKYVATREREIIRQKKNTD